MCYGIEGIHKGGSGLTPETLAHRLPHCWRHHTDRYVHAHTQCTHLFLLLIPSLHSAVGTSSLFSAPRVAGAILTEHLELDLE